jgi:hypothetical protein
MHDAPGWFLDARLAKIVVAVWLLAVIGYGFWRSMGAAPPDAIRESGPID